MSESNEHCRKGIHKQKVYKPPLPEQEVNDRGILQQQLSLDL